MRGELAVKLNLFRRFLVSRCGQCDLRGEQVLRLEAETSVESLEKSLDQNAGARQQENCHRYFSGYEHAAATALLFSGGNGSAVVFQCGEHFHRPGSQGWRESKEKSGEHRDS